MDTVLVTGADRRLGLEICRAYLQKGWTVFAGQYEKQLPYLDELKNQYPKSLIILPLDVSDGNSVENAMRLVSEQTEKLDMLVHNAAIMGGACGDIKQPMDIQNPTLSFNVNALGAVRLAYAFRPLMEKGKKRFCFISSEAGSIGVCARDEVSLYCLSKAALNMAIRRLFNELRPEGYTFRVFHPGWMPADIHENRPGCYAARFLPEESAAVAVRQFWEERSWEDSLVMLDTQEEAWPF